MTEEGRPQEGDVEAETRWFRERWAVLTSEIGRVIVGYPDTVRLVLVAAISGYHVLLEGVPGLGKTLLVRTLAGALSVTFRRIQFTPDLMPADITGTNIIVEDESGHKRFEFNRGPIFGHVVLADEINRATPKTQSALLEAMQERSVTVGGQTYILPAPFFVLATQNPIEMEGTYPLPEAQLDRFLLKVEVQAPGAADLVEVLRRTTGSEVPAARPVVTGEDLLRMGALARAIPAPSPVLDYAARLVLATHPTSPEAVEATRRYVRYGASPRGAQALIAAAKVLALSRGRLHASTADCREVAPPALRHRIILNFEGESEGLRPDGIIESILAEVPEASREVRELLGTP